MPPSAAAKTTKPSPTPAAGKRPDLLESLEQGRRGRDRQGLAEADLQFGGDLRAELAAIEAGTHPLQRRRHTEK